MRIKDYVDSVLGIAHFTSCSKRRPSKIQSIPGDSNFWRQLRYNYRFLSTDRSISVRAKEENKPVESSSKACECEFSLGNTCCLHSVHCHHRVHSFFSSRLSSRGMPQVNRY